MHIQCIFIITLSNIKKKWTQFVKIENIQNRPLSFHMLIKRLNPLSPDRALYNSFNLDDSQSVLHLTLCRGQIEIHVILSHSLHCSLSNYFFFCRWVSLGALFLDSKGEGFILSRGRRWVNATPPHSRPYSIFFQPLFGMCMMWLREPTALFLEKFPRVTLILLEGVDPLALSRLRLTCPQSDKSPQGASKSHDVLPSCRFE